MRQLEEREPLEYVDGSSDEFGKVLRELENNEGHKNKKDEDDEELKGGENEEEEPKGANLSTKEDLVLRVFTVRNLITTT